MQRRRSQRPRPPPRVNLSFISSSDDSGDDSRTFVPPRVHDGIKVCYFDSEDERSDDAEVCDAGNVTWWSATVTAVLCVLGCSDIKCVANVRFWPVNKKPAQVCSMFFLDGGLVIEAADYNTRSENTSEWRYVSRVADHPDQGGQSTAPRARNERRDARARNEIRDARENGRTTDAGTVKK